VSDPSWSNLLFRLPSSSSSSSSSVVGLDNVVDSPEGALSVDRNSSYPSSSTPGAAVVVVALVVSSPSPPMTMIFYHNTLSRETKNNDDVPTKVMISLYDTRSTITRALST